MKKIETLTHEQESKFDEFVDKWIKIGMSTEPTNDDEILAAIPQYYKEGGLKPPDEVIICPSPIAALYTGAQILTENRKDSKFEDNIKEVWSARVGTSLWAGYNSWRDYMGYIGVDISELTATFSLAKNCCYVFPFNNFITISEKPSKMLFDDNGELHSENSMAIEWKDGFGFYCLHGVRMCGNEWVCETLKEDLDPEKIMSIKNVEQRLMAIKKCGIDKVLNKLDSKIISEGALDKSGLVYKLYSVNIADSYEKLMALPNPSENKTHYEFVPPDCQTIFEADLWRRNYDDYKTRKYQPTGSRA